MTEQTQQPQQTLPERRDELENEIAVIKAKLSHVRSKKHATGVYADADWYHRATSRLRFLGVEHQRVLRQLAWERRTAGDVRRTSVERAFVAIARERLDGLEFDTLMAKAVAAAEGADRG